MRQPLMSGHCAHPVTHTLHGNRISTDEAHARCLGYNRANPAGEFQPCPCSCHLGTDEYECGNCGGALREAPLWPNEDEPGEMVYVHIDPLTGRAIGEEC
jgi:hypothetical protein